MMLVFAIAEERRRCLVMSKETQKEGLASVFMCASEANDQEVEQKQN
jgi:hypothetical protein